MRLIYVASKNTARVALEEVKAGAIRFENLPPVEKKFIDKREESLVKA